MWFFSDKLFSASRRKLRAYTTPLFFREKSSSVKSLFPSHKSDFHLSANFGAGFPDPFPTFGKCTKTVSANSTNFPRCGPPIRRYNGDCVSLPRKRGMTHAACLIIDLINELSANGLYFVCCCIAASIMRT